MATWKDGAEYAPRERPTGFATPVADPLSRAEERAATTPGAIPPPRRLEPVDAAPLDAPHTRESAPRRNPGQPFDVASTALTSVGALPGEHRDPRAPFAVVAPSPTAPPAAPAPPPPGAKPLPAPTAVPTTPATQATAGQTPPLLWLMFGLASVGMVFPNATPILAILIGVLGLRLPGVGKLGAGFMAAGSSLLLLQMFVASPALTTLFTVSSLVAAAALLILIVTRRQASARPGDDGPDDDRGELLWGPGDDDQPPRRGRS